MNLEAVNVRVDGALARNRRAEGIVVGMAVGIFLLGCAVVAVAYWAKNPYVATGSFLFQSLLAWPIREILKLRRENLILQTVPVLISTLPPDQAVKEMSKMLAVVRGGKP